MLDIEQSVNERIEKNDEYLREFVDYLEESGLKEKTIDKHVGNVAFYINEFLVYHYDETMQEGTSSETLDDFFGNFFTRKCLWSTPQTIRESIAGLNKFYKCMFDKKYISAEEYEEYKFTIKVSKDVWIETCSDYNSGDTDMFFF